ncbi:MAG TPA: hypothetical protein VFZ71_04435, partial [Pyrinomonadaceae bacterium]
MSRLITFLTLFLVTCAAHAAPWSTIFSGEYSKHLKSNININDKAYILTGGTDPTVTPVRANPGSLYLMTSTPGRVFVKLDSGLTSNWSNGLTTQTGWRLDGNSGTSASTNFLGTSDAVDLVLRTNNSERLRATSGGLLGFGTSSPTFAYNFKQTASGSPNQFALEAPGALVTRFWTFEPTAAGNLHIKNNDTSGYALTLGLQHQVGVGGSVAPDYTFQVHGSSTSTTPATTLASSGPIAAIRNTDSTNGNWSSLYMQSGNQVIDSLVAGIHDNHNAAGSATGHLELYTRDNGTMAKRGHLDATGLGLGNISPTVMLDVNGGARVRSLTTPGAVRVDSNGYLQATGV